MQTLEFSLNYVTSFGWWNSWQPEEEEPTLLSLICEEMPIEILKFTFKELTNEDNFNWRVLSKVPPTFWSNYWVSNDGVAEALSCGKVDMELLEGLQKLRRLQFCLDLANCVFDKLNEHSQKNIK